MSIYKNKYRTKLVVVDGVYSQDGDTASLEGILKICRAHGAYLMVDDAHGIGVVGNTGRGVLERDNVEFSILVEFPIFQTTKKC